MVVHNPNNWHWVDKNCIDWTRNYFKEHLVGVTADEGNLSVSVNKVTSVEGDVEVCQRKGKVISLFDLKVVLAVEGYDKDDDSKKVTGSITVPEVAYDTERDEFQFDVAMNSSSDVEKSTEEKVRQAIKSKLVPKIRDVLAEFGKDLITTHSSDIQVPESEVKSTYTKGNQSGFKATTSTTQTTKEETATETGVPRYNTSTLHLQPVFNTTADQLYMTLLEKDRVAAWTRAPPNIEAKEGSEYHLFGGNVSGKIVKLVPNAQIEMLWRLSTWKAGHFANLNIQLHQGYGETKMEVLFKGIPVGEEEVVQDNFEEQYIRAIKVVFGFGAVL